VLRPSACRPGGRGTAASVGFCWEDDDDDDASTLPSGCRSKLAGGALELELVLVWGGNSVGRAAASALASMAELRILHLGTRPRRNEAAEDGVAAAITLPSSHAMAGAPESNDPSFWTRSTDSGWRCGKDRKDRSSIFQTMGLANLVLTAKRDALAMTAGVPTPPAPMPGSCCRMTLIKLVAG